MKCLKCSKSNREDGNFCRYCGGKLIQGEKVRKTQKIFLEFTKLNLINKFKERLFGRKSNKKNLTIIIIALVIFSLGFSYAKGFVGSINLIKEAQKSMLDGNYEEALSLLTTTKLGWGSNVKKNEIENIKSSIGRFLKEKESYNSAIKKEQSGDLESAREILRTISLDYPQYELVKTKLQELQDIIEKDIKQRAESAEQRARSEMAAKARAQAEAEARTAEAHAAEIVARQAEQQRQQEEIRRRQEEETRAKQIKTSFLNQLVSVLNSYQSAVTYYNDAMSYYNYGFSASDDIVAISKFSQAKAVMVNVRNDARSLINTFSNLQSDYSEAARNMHNASDYFIRAIDGMINDISNEVSNSEVNNYYSNTAYGYVRSVSSFLSSQGY